MRADSLQSLTGKRVLFRDRNSHIATCGRLVVMLVAVALSACSTRPLAPFTTETTPLVLGPASQADVRDERARFREIFCEVLDTRGPVLPDYRPCDEALAQIGTEPAGTGKRVGLGPSRRQLVAVFVPGVGWDCFAEWLDSDGSETAHVRQFGYDHVILEVGGLSGTATNARRIRDAIMQMPERGEEPYLVLIGYSKGAPDILEAIVSYPEIRPRIAAAVSLAGTVGGSPLANDAQQSRLRLLTRWPGARCSPDDGGAIESVRSATRKRWLAGSSLPNDVPYYSLVTFPDPGRISFVLRPTYNKLSRVDARNDGQMLFYDQVIPGSALLGYLNADHWAAAVPIARSHPFLGSTFVNHNEFPREALLEALLRFVEEDLEANPH